MHALWHGVRFQLWVFRSDRNQLLIFTTVPLLCIVFLSIVRFAGRSDLTTTAVLAPALIGLWYISLDVAGSVIDSERAQGTLELTIAAPASTAALVFGRVAAVAGVGLAVFPESWLTARLLFGVAPSLGHPGPALLALIVTAFAMVGAASIMATVFVLARTAMLFTNALGYPFYILGGVLVPVAFLPGWLRPVSRLVFLSWSSDLLRDALSAAPIRDLMLRLGVIAGLGLLEFGAALVLMRGMVRRASRQGTLGLR